MANEAVIIVGGSVAHVESFIATEVNPRIVWWLTNEVSARTGWEVMPKTHDRLMRLIELHHTALILLSTKEIYYLHLIKGDTFFCGKVMLYDEHAIYSV